MTYCCPLSRLRAQDAPRFGGKSASLGELLGAGLPVPPGFGLSIDAFEAFVEQSGLRAEIDHCLDGVSGQDAGALQEACRSVAAAFASKPVTSELAEEIPNAYRELGEPPVAVRSSAVGEDSATATFAGQQETFLWVQGTERVVAAVRDCWASLYSAPAVSYRARLGSATDAPAMGVAVQKMIDARVAGVMFTCSPASGDPSVIAVNASWGLGESVVSGEVTPDELLISKVTGELLRETIGDKQTERVAAPEAGGTVAREVEAERRRVRCVSDEDLLRLVELAKQAQRHFGAHQDIEWAIAPGGELFALQSRPVTGRAEQDHPRSSEPASAISLVMSSFGVKP